MNRETKDRCAMTAIAALYGVPISSWEQWVSRETLHSIGDAIADEVEMICPECGQPEGDCVGDCLRSN